MNVVSLPIDDKEPTLEVIDNLREAVASGRVVAFAAVGIEADHTTAMWLSSTNKTKITRLTLIGAIHHLLHCYESESL